MKHGRGGGCMAVGRLLLCLRYWSPRSPPPAQAQTEPVSFAGKQIKLLDRLLARPATATTPMAGCWRGTSANIFPAIPPSSRRTGRAPARSISRTISTTRPPATAPRSPWSAAASPWSRCIGGAAAQGKFDSTQIRLARQHEQRGVGLVHPARRAGCEPAGDPGRHAPADGLDRRRRRPAGLHGGAEFAARHQAQADRRLPGTQEIMLAIERGELDGIVGYSWGVARAGNKDDLASGKLKIVMQLGLEKHRDLPNIPMLDDFVRKPEDRQVLDLIFSRQAMGRPLWRRPGSIRASSRRCAGLRRGHARSAVHRRGRQDGPGARIRRRRRGAGAGRAALPIPAQRDRARPGDRGGELAPAPSLVLLRSTMQAPPARRMFCTGSRRPCACPRLAELDRRCRCRGCAISCSTVMDHGPSACVVALGNPRSGERAVAREAGAELHAPGRRATSVTRCSNCRRTG